MARQAITDVKDEKTFVKLDKVNLKPGETARLFLIEGADWIVEYSHELRKKPRLTQAEKAAGAQDTPEDYYGSYLCLGKQEILEAGELDAGNCPFCESIAASKGRIGRPRRGYAANVIRFMTTHGTHDPLTPIQVSRLAWVHKDGKKYAEIKGIANTWGDLTKRDLLITNTNQFQAYTIQPSPNTLTESPEVMALVQQTYDQQKYSDEDLTSGLGNAVDAEGARRHADAVVSYANNVIAETSQQVAPVVTQQPVMQAMQNMPQVPVAQAGPIDMSVMSAPPVAQEAPVMAAVAQTPAPAVASVDVDNMPSLAGLDS